MLVLTKVLQDSVVFPPCDQLFSGLTYFVVDFKYLYSIVQQFGQLAVRL